MDHVFLRQCLLLRRLERVNRVPLEMFRNVDFLPLPDKFPVNLRDVKDVEGDVSVGFGDELRRVLIRFYLAGLHYRDELRDGFNDALNNREVIPSLLHQKEGSFYHLLRFHQSYRDGNLFMWSHYLLD